MGYVFILVGAYCITMAVAAVILLTRPRLTNPQSFRQPDRICSAEEPDSKLRRKLNDQRTRNSRPGDKCPMCLEEMSQDNMHPLKCGHAMDKECFEDFRYIRRDCLLCGQCVNPSLPGDECSICCEKLTKNNMAFMPCMHALHRRCLRELKADGSQSCPVCIEKL
ncbi:probable E3 ubiquitin-protein ligase RZFP34 [Drosophila ficusphila]|uniref:probable E3 ubiquitin-protein ligase RZFP34 n=1 Tax=Drosophila ficusphila TaxID=30025 RepID=UPI0007E8A363|nr:probable E3 ubiquitin-protein ligase RZFP34 [Drosophila ficusphila]